MEIKGYRFSNEEEQTLYKILETFKTIFPNAQLQFRNDIIGIGEEGKHLMCYLVFYDTLYIKFKVYTDKQLFVVKDYRQEIEDTIAFFQGNFTLLSNKSPKKDLDESAPAIKNSFKYEGDLVCFEQDFYDDYSFIIASLKEEQWSIGFETCSVRLYNALYKKGIRTVGDLRKYSAKDIREIRRLGVVSWCELGEMLAKLTQWTFGGRYIQHPAELNGNNIEQVDVPKEGYFGIRELQNYVKDFFNTPIILNFDNAVEIYQERITEYENLYLEYFEYIIKRAKIRLKPSELAVFNERFASETGKTLEEIGNKYNLSRERIRQIEAKAVKKLLVRKATRLNVLQLEAELCNKIEKIRALSIEGMIAYVFFEKQNQKTFQIMFELLMKIDLSAYHLKTTLLPQYKKWNKKENVKQVFFEKIHQQIEYFERKRKITQEDFDRLHLLQDIPFQSKIMRNVEIEGKEYHYLSEKEKNFIEKLVVSNLFKEIKTHSLKVAIDDQFCYSDIQCFTHDGYFVIIEFIDALQMCRYRSIKKFKKLKSYCQKYGFGLLITDGRGISFYGVNTPNLPFEQQIMQVLNIDQTFDFETYNKIYKECNANIANLLTLIKKYNLFFELPFVLSKSIECNEY